MNKKIEKLLVQAGIAINNSLQNAKLQPYLAEYGYSVEKLTEGKTLLDNTLALNNEQEKELGEKIQSTDNLEQKMDEAHRYYMRLLKIARIVFVNEPGAWTALGLSGDRNASVSGWLMQSGQFYINLESNTQWMEKLAGFGITSEKLAAGETLTAEVEAANMQQKTEMGEAQEATRLRDKAADTLQKWHSDFIAIARIALEDKPQFLEMLGVVKK